MIEIGNCAKSNRNSFLPGATIEVGTAITDETTEITVEKDSIISND